MGSLHTFFLSENIYHIVDPEYSQNTKNRFALASTHKDNNEIPLRAKEVLPGMVGGHKKVISYFLGNGWLRSRRFLFQQFFHGVM